MSGVAIVSANYGAYDVLKPVLPQQDIDAEWILVTDDGNIPDGTLGWKVIHEPHPGADPMRAAKAPKVQPWKYTDAPASIWIDGSYRVLSPRFAIEVLALASPIAVFGHQDRDCIYQEAPVSLPIPKYAGEPITEQAEHYRAMGHPEHWGMWTTSAIARHHTPQVVRLGQDWADEIAEWSTQDQVSFPYVCRNEGIRPALIPGFYRQTRWLQLEASGKHQ